MLFRDVEVAGRAHLDVRIAGDRIVGVGQGLGADEVIDGRGGALLPGLHDHHCHLLATAAAADSVACGPPDVLDRAMLAATLHSAGPGWVRGVGYHESVAGELDRIELDALRSDVPIRVQHRSGALWMLNSAAVDRLDVQHAQLDGIERDAAGRPTGRLWRADHWLRDRVHAPPPDLGPLSTRLAAHGVTGVTDATPELAPGTIALLRAGAVRQRLTLLGDPDGGAPMKVVVPDHQLPDYPLLVAALAAVRPRAVAVHCVTRAALVLVLAALADVGPVRGDRIEHAAVAPPETIATMRRLGLVVVTQPSLPWRRGDDYLDDVDPDDLEWLWPFRSLVAAGVPVACSSDAPYGDIDPWSAIRAAATRRTRSGRPIAAHEAVPAAMALRGYLGSAGDPGGPARTVRPGAPADVVLLDRPLADMLADPAAEHIVATVIAGDVVHRRSDVASGPGR